MLAEMGIADSLVCSWSFHEALGQSRLRRLPEEIQEIHDLF